MAKRANGEGTIYRHTDGRWRAIMTVGVNPVTGKMIRKYFYGKTQKDVREQLKQAREAQARGDNPSSTRTKLSGFLDTWLEEVIQPTRSQRTHESYCYLVRDHIKPFLGNIAVTRLTPRDVQVWINGRTQAGLAPRTVEYCRAVLRRALNQALIWGEVHRNVATLVTLPRKDRAERTVLSAIQAKLFIEACHGEKLGSLFVFAIATGMRKGELLGLKWSDVDEVKGVVRVQRQVQRRSGETYFTDPKTARSVRSISLPQFALSALEHQKEIHAINKARRNPYDDSLGLVFAGDHGNVLDQRGVSRNLDELLAALQLPRMRFHDLRHTFATLLLSTGVATRIAQDALGHSSANVTQTVYQHVLQDMRDGTAKALDSLLGSTQEKLEGNQDEGGTTGLNGERPSSD